MIGIGIDTGGTYTDAVIYDMTTREVLSYGKSLTTKAQLEIGIDRALGLLDQLIFIDGKPEHAFSEPEAPDWEMVKEKAPEWFADCPAAGVCQIYPNADGGKLEQGASVNPQVELHVRYVGEEMGILFEILVEAVATDSFQL